MKLSVIIVNYNVRYFLEQCLKSLFQALEGIEAEVFVVDNNSVDGSVTMLREDFPEVICIANSENTGFSTANNQAIRQAKGEYILLLNPDTLVQEDTFTKTLAFMDAHPDAGGLGVKMIDGKGQYLPESKRSLPAPMVAFYKISGLLRLFPRSKRFARYYLGHLDHRQTHEVEILSGAFMLMRKTALDKAGYLDETFFMYGEDIDLSYRILKAGYKNYYYADTRIIHYKGESTKKGSLNYVFLFYKAMIIFARKHFSAKNAKLFSSLIYIAIYLRAGMALLYRFVKRISLPLVDITVLYGGMYYLKSYWEKNHRFVEGGAYPDEFILYAVPSYIVVWLCSVYFSGGYDKPLRISKIIRGIVFGTLVILAVYGLLSEQYRFSRALIILGSFWAALSIPALRLLTHHLLGIKLLAGRSYKKKLAIAGSEQEFNRLLSVLHQSQLDYGFIGFINSQTDKKSDNKNLVGTLDQLNEIISIYQIDELIFCAKDLSAQRIIELMSQTAVPGLELKIAPPESMYIIGSNSINAQGELYTLQVNAINKAENKRNKRLLDLTAACVFIVCTPFFLFFVREPAGLLRNCIRVLIGKCSWVSYHPHPHNKLLPKIKAGILSPIDALKTTTSDQNTIDKLNVLYAKEYNIRNDLSIIWLGLRSLGRSSGSYDDI